MNTTEHAMHFPELPYYLTVYKVIDTTKDLVSILVRSKIHVNKEIKLPMQYSIDYARENPDSVRAEAFSAVVKRFGLKPEPLKYS
jgi:hypothetical protein